MKVIVVGAGMVGLSCAWFLQERGARVQVLERGRVGSGASWGNAGYVSPAHSVPLPEPGILRYGLRAVLDRGSPVSLPVRGDGARARFLAALVRHCTHAAWRRGMAGYRPVNELALAAHDDLIAGGVRAELTRADVVAAFRDGREATADLAEFARMAEAGQVVDFELLTAQRLRELEPALTPVLRAGLLVRGQAYLHPARYLTALADAVRERGAEITEHTPVMAATRLGTDTVARTEAGEELAADAVVLANGAWVGALAARHGVRTPVHAGRGYSFSLPTTTPLRHPVHMPATRLALTPDGDRVRVIGVMEFTGPDAPANPRRFRSMVDALSPLVSGLDWAGRGEDWVGPRPLSSDGLPLAGATATAGVYIAGGHGMWGITLGPVTGRLLAELITTGHTPRALTPFNPLR